MCYFNGLRVSRDEFIRLKEIEKEIKHLNMIRPMQDGFDYSDWPILKPKGTNEFDILEMEWGFIPDSSKWPFIKTREDVKKFRFGYKDATGKFIPVFTILNAVGEDLLTGKFYKEAALQRRCLVLSSWFYEWRHLPAIGKKGQPLKATIKYPYTIELNNNKEYFFMAGIWQPWTDESTGETVETFAIVTTKSNEFMAQIHNVKKRQPTILTEDLAAEWIWGDLTEKRITEIATWQMPAKEMTAYSVQKDFKEADNPREAFHFDELPALVL